MKRILLSLIVMALCAGLGAAQPVHGDFIVADGSLNNRNIGYIDVGSPTPTITGISPRFSGLELVRWLLMAENNRDIIAAVGGGGSAGWVGRVTPAGVVSTIVSFSGRGYATGIDMAQDGGYYLSTRTSTTSTVNPNAIMHLSPSQVLTTVTPSLPGGVNDYPENVALDHDLGNIIAGNFDFVATRPLWEIDRTSGQIVRTIVAPFSRFYAVEPIPRTGGFVVTTRVTPDLRIYDQNGNQTASTLCGGFQAFLSTPKVDDATGNIFCSSGFNTVTEFASDLSAVVKSYGPFTNYTLSNFEIYGSRRVSGSGPATPNSAYAISLDFGPAAANYGVFVGLALAQRPGIALPGGTVNLAFDPLLTLSLTGALNGTILTGFPATLDANGRGAGNVNIPSIFPGFRFFVSAVAAQGSTILTANTIGVHVN